MNTREYYVECFKAEFLAAGGVFHAAPDTEAARQNILDLVKDRGARKVLEGVARSRPVGCDGEGDADDVAVLVDERAA